MQIIGMNYNTPSINPKLQCQTPAFGTRICNSLQDLFVEAAIDRKLTVQNLDSLKRTIPEIINDGMPGTIKLAQGKIVLETEEMSKSLFQAPFDIPIFLRNNHQAISYAKRVDDLKKTPFLAGIEVNGLIKKGYNAVIEALNPSKIKETQVELTESVRAYEKLADEDWATYSKPDEVVRSIFLTAKSSHKAS